MPPKDKTSGAKNILKPPLSIIQTDGRQSQIRPTVISNKANMDSFIQHIKPYGTLDKPTSDRIKELLTIEKLKKNEFFLQSDHYCNKIGFIKTGVFRLFFTDKDGSEITRYFLAENQFIVDLKAFNHRTLSTDNIQSLTDSEIISLDRHALETIPTFFKAWNDIFRQLTENALLEKMHNRSCLVYQDARSKYLTFVEQNGNLANRIPLGHLASYLGIKQQSLSRIRKELTKP